MSTTDTNTNTKRKFEEDKADANDDKASPKFVHDTQQQKEPAGVYRDAANAAPPSEATVASTHPNAPSSTSDSNNAAATLGDNAPAAGLGGKTLLDAHYFSPSFLDALTQSLALKQGQFAHKAQAVEFYHSSFERIQSDVNGLLVLPAMTKESEILHRSLLASYGNVCQSLQASVVVATEEAKFLAYEIQELFSFLNMLMKVGDQWAGGAANTTPQGNVGISPGLFAPPQQQVMTAVASSPSAAATRATTSVLTTDSGPIAKKAKSVAAGEGELPPSQLENGQLEVGASGDEKELAEMNSVIA